MAGKKYEKYFLKEPWGRKTKTAGVKAPAGTPPEMPYWLGIGQEEPEAWGFPLSMVLRPIWEPREMGEGRAHTHKVGEILYFIGGDPMNFKDFGAEAELIMGEEKESYFINSTTFVYFHPNCRIARFTSGM